MTFIPKKPDNTYPVVIHRHSWILLISILAGGVLGGLSYCLEPYLQAAVIFFLMMAHPGIVYAVFRFRKAVVHRDKIVYKGFLRKLSVDLSDVKKVYQCDQYVWGGDWHLPRILASFSRTPALSSMRAGKLRSWNYKPGIFYIDNQDQPRAMLLSRSYKDWRYALNVLPEGAEVDHIKDKIHPESELWHSITPDRESFGCRVFFFIPIFFLSLFVIFFVTVILWHYVEAWLR